MPGRAFEGIRKTVRQARLTRVLLVYFGGSLAVLEGVDVFTNQLGLPDWFFPGALMLLVLGLPVVVATAIIQATHAERTPPVLLATPSGAAGREVPTRASIESPASKPSPAPPSAPVVKAAKPWLTWRKTILGGVFVLALWGLVVAAYMTMRALGIGPVGSLVAAGVLEAREPIILADFQNSAGDPVLARAATEAFRIDLAQSPLVTVVDPSFVDKALSRMQVHPETSLDLDLAREIAIREGIKAVMGGEITTVGAGFVISAQLVSAEGGEVLAAYRETSKDSTAIIRAIDRLSKKLRERIGESLKTIRANEPLDQVTTASLKALRKYSQAVGAIEEGDASKGRALLEEAVELDTAFAMAWRKLGLVAIGRTRRVEALTKAFQHRDRLTDRERYLTLGTYYGGVTDEREKAITAYRTLLDTYPNDSWALNNLAVLYNNARDYTRAEDMYRRAIEADSFTAVSYTNLVSVKFALGKLEEAEATLERLAEYFPDHPNIASYRINLASARGDYEAAEVQAQAFKEAHKGEVYRQFGANQLLIGLAMVRGRLAEAERLSLEVLHALEKLGLGGGQLEVQIGLALVDVWFRGDTASGQRRVETAVERTPLEEIDPLNRPYLSLARFYALAGRPDRTHATLAEFDAAVEPELRRDAENDRHGILGIIALNDGRYSDAVEEFRRSDEGPCAICVFPGLGLAFDQAGEADSAMAYYEGYVTGPWLFRLDEDAIFLAMCYERLGALYEERGEPEKAIRYYGRLVELWKDADPELKPRVETARRAIQALSTDRPGGDGGD